MCCPKGKEERPYAGVMPFLFDGSVIGISLIIDKYLVEFLKCRPRELKVIVIDNARFDSL
jgi:hypothetical protein